MLVFRDGRRTVPASGLVEALAAELRSLGGRRATRRALIAALLRAGELECALADWGSDHPAPAEITDALAAALVSHRPLPEFSKLLDRLARTPIPSSLRISIPEGFAYYALHPLDYSDLAQEAAQDAGRVAVVGVRSIGTTLSAVVAAACREQGLPADRITARPQGHPFDRRTEFSREQAEWIGWWQRRGAQFMVVDEGPGMSGSSLVSVAEALEDAGVPRSQILILCSHQPDLQRLCARDAARRWSRFRWRNASTTRFTPGVAGRYLGGGEWRRLLLPSHSDWPASWTGMERLKFLSRSGHHLLKFEGHGRHGAEVWARAQWLNEIGFGPAATVYGDGFVRYPLLRGGALRASDGNRATLERLAEYCAMRSAEFRSSAEPTDLGEMARVNQEEEFGISEVPELQPERVVIADGRMQPHEWVRSADGTALKVDGAAHGDDHFYPGPTDIAWDLAGAIVEWGLEGGAREFFLARYARFSGDRPQHRLPAYLQAYALFRMGYSKMAAGALAGSPEATRLERDYVRYRHIASGFSSAAA